MEPMTSEETRELYRIKALDSALQFMAIRGQSAVTAQEHSLVTPNELINLTERIYNFLSEETPNAKSH